MARAKKSKKPKSAPKTASTANGSKALARRVIDGDRAALARALSRLEARGPEAAELVRALHPHTGKARTVGFTGPPGAGKSTLVNALIGFLRKRGLKVAALAVDPSSPFSGGAVLGDRIRMQEHTLDPGVFIRSAGTRGRSGGLSQSAREAVAALDAAGFDVVLVESVGVGQTEWDIRDLVQTTFVVLVPESGDSIQMMKAGLMEIADVFLVNKADLAGADRMEQEILSWVRGDDLKAAKAGAWQVPVVRTQGASGQGLEALWKAAENHQKHLATSPEGAARTERFYRRQIVDASLQILQQRLEAKLAGKPGKALLKSVMTRRTNPSAAIRRLTGK